MYPPIYTDILAALMHKKLFYIMQFIYSRINICNQHQDCYQSKRRNSLIDQYATNKRSDDIPHIHDVGNITIDESDIFMSLSEDYRLENRAKDALMRNAPAKHKKEPKIHVKINCLLEKYLSQKLLNNTH